MYGSLQMISETPRLMASPDPIVGFPHLAEDLTAEWVTSALRAGGVGHDVEVASIEYERLAAGVGFMGEVARLRLGYRSAPDGAPASVIVKIPTQNPEVRAMLGPARVYERETRFYQQLAGRPEVAAPKCFYAGIDAAADEHVLLLEDLSAWRNGDQASACSVADAHGALAALAAFHAAFWESDSLRVLDWLPAINAEINKLTAEAVYAKSLRGFLEIFGDSLSTDTMDMAQRYGKGIRQLLDRLEALPNTVVHFDFRLDNLFFDGPDDSPVRLIDFQAVARGGGAYDVGYFLSQSLDIEDRRAHEPELLGTYLDSLAANGVSGYGRDQLEQDIRIGMLYSWIIPVMAVGGGFDLSDERALRLWRAVVARSQAAITDHRAAELLDA